MISSLPVFSADETKKLDAIASQQGIAGEKMMRKAGEEIAKAVIRFAHFHQLPHELHVIIGKGNNGGDGIVAAIELLDQGWDVQVYSCFKQGPYSPLSSHFQNQWIKKGKDILAFPSYSLSNGMILDGIFGIGFQGPLDSHTEEMITALNAMNLPILAIDIPSGLDGNTGRVESVAIKATMTLSLGYPKVGYYLDQGISYVGEIECLDYGLTQEIVMAISPSMQLLDPEKVAELLPEVDHQTHKYKKGYLLVVGGCKGMYGAPKLASLAALRTGCGIVRFFYPLQDEMFLGDIPFELIHEGLKEQDLSSLIKEQARAGALLIGPGMNPDITSKQWVQSVIKEACLPLVIDGGALSLFSLFQKSCHHLEKIVTPHRGEALRLTHQDASISDEKLIQALQAFCINTHSICVLKGPVTYILSVDQKPLIIPYGCPAMATAGSGDVLAGMIAAFIAKGMPLYESATLGVYLHQMAGHLARNQQSEEGVIASDIIEAIPHAYTKLSFKR